MDTQEYPESQEYPKSPDTPRETYPPLEREVSLSASQQGDEITCAYHASAKVVIKNIIEFISSLPVHDRKTYMDNNCNQYLNTTNLKNLSMLTPENCTEAGYEKILWFIYLFSSYKEYLQKKYDTSDICAMDTSEMYRNTIDTKLFNKDHIPSEFPEKFNDDMLKLKQDMIKKSRGIYWITQHIAYNPTLYEMIEKVTHAGLYVGLDLKDSSSADVHNKHAVHIVGTTKRPDGNYIIIKNSWGDAAHYHNIASDIFTLGVYSFKLKYLTFLIPKFGFMSQPPRLANMLVDTGQIGVFDMWIDSFIAELQYKTMGGRKTKQRKTKRPRKSKKTVRKFKSRVSSVSRQDRKK
jgi:hypothetical protein